MVPGVRDSGVASLGSLGFDSVQRFAEERRGRSFPGSENYILVDDAFWERRNNVSALRHTVINKLQLMSETVEAGEPAF